MFKQQLQQKLQQRLTPQQVQLIRLLELPLLELEERVKTELEENPALEEGKEAQEDTEQEDQITDEYSENNEERTEDIDIGDYRTEEDIPDYKLREIQSKAEKKEDIPFSVDETLSELLLEQLGQITLKDKDRLIAQYIIGYIEDDGYIRTPLSQIEDDLLFQASIEASTEEIEKVLTIVQTFEPAGVAARNLQECLLIQIKRRSESKTTSLTTILLEKHFDDYSQRRYVKIMESLNIDEDTLKQINKEIISLIPRPGSSVSDSADTAMNQITPDFLVETNGSELTLSLNNKAIPEMRINRSYANMLHDYQSNKNNQTAEKREALIFIKQKIDAAQGFIDSVRQRQDTLRRTMEAIIHLQSEFFFTGQDADLKPMILKDVAQQAGLDISTISRVSGKKYVQTNFGIYSLKYFFSESTQTDSGEEISTRNMKRILQEYIDAEDKKKPITDDELTNILNSKGYQIARRTVAKYREQLNIPIARLRKEI